jgi:RimJ/RimL family protein N-acetyltransferase
VLPTYREAVIHAHGLTLRPWRAADRDALIAAANNRAIWLNLQDRFPHPYTAAEAEAWLAHCEAEAGQPTRFAIEVAGAAVGGVGFARGTDVHRLTAEIGYWLAEPMWGNGLATTALTAATAYAFATFDLVRLQASVFEWNPASARVLEKAGYTFEGRRRRDIVKAGRIGDSLMYAKLRD